MSDGSGGHFYVALVVKWEIFNVISLSIYMTCIYIIQYM